MRGRLTDHELCICFLMDISDTGILSKGQKLTLNEGGRIHTFEWLKFERLKGECFYPRLLKEEIFRLPQAFTIRTEFE